MSNHKNTDWHQYTYRQQSGRSTIAQRAPATKESNEEEKCTDRYGRVHGSSPDTVVHSSTTRYVQIIGGVRVDGQPDTNTKHGAANYLQKNTMIAYLNHTLSDFGKLSHIIYNLLTKACSIVDCFIPIHRYWSTIFNHILRLWLDILNTVWCLQIWVWQL